MSIILHDLFNQKEFTYFIKIYFFGLIAGIILSLIYGFLNQFFVGKAAHFTILLKSLFIDGILLTLLISGSLYYILNFILDLSASSSWSISTIMIFTYLSGVFTVSNIFESLNNNYFNNLLDFLTFLSLLLFVSMILGFGLPNFIDAYELFKKILWCFFVISILIVSFGFYYYEKFYFSNLQYYIIIPSIILTGIFGYFDFKYFLRR
jgi:hypothetical protein